MDDQKSCLPWTLRKLFISLRGVIFIHEFSLIIILNLNSFFLRSSTFSDFKTPTSIHGLPNVITNDKPFIEKSPAALPKKQIVSTLQARIKFVGLRIAKNGYFWLDNSNPVKHLLPCISGVAPSAQWAETKTIEWCLNFNDRMIKSFEIVEVSEHLHALHQLSCSKVEDTTLFTKNWERVERAIPVELISDSGVLEQLRRRLVFLTTCDESRFYCMSMNNVLSRKRNIC